MNSGIQVAYDTLSRRDRKTRHMKVAAHLRAAFAGDGEEVADVIARHLGAQPGPGHQVGGVREPGHVQASRATRGRTLRVSLREGGPVMPGV